MLSPHSARPRPPPGRVVPNSRLVEIADSYTLVPIDQPAALAMELRRFIDS
jgi:hypothetical protein